jgi:CBS domain-containing protein
MKTSEIMTATVVTVGAATSIAEAARTMIEKRVSGLPVMDAAGTLIGMVTEGDLLRRAEIGTERRRSRWLELLLGPGRAAEEYMQAHARKVAEVMSERIVSVRPDTPLDQVVALMEEHKIKRLPVVDGAKLVGIVARADLLRALLKFPEAKATNIPDAVVREKILAEIAAQPWTPMASIDIAVTDGIAELRGVITDERERMALRVVVENVPGVTKIVDRLVWVDPISGMTLPSPAVRGQ